MILCGGEGTRLRPYTYNVPKPMLPIAGKPILQYVIENLKRQGFTEIILMVGYLHEQIQNYFKDGKRFGVSITYSIETEALSTAGAIYGQKEKVKDVFAVLMGDHVTNINLAKMVDYHKKQKAIGTIAIYSQKKQLEYGIVNMESNGTITGFSEKPTLETNINTAMYVFDAKIFEYIKPREDFAKHVFPRVLKEGKDRLIGYPLEEVWYDIGRVSDYEKVNELMQTIRLGKDLLGV